MPQNRQFSKGGDERRTHILDNAEAIPIADPLTLVEKISGVHPYKIAHIADEAKEAPTVLALNNSGPSALANTKQQKPLRKVLPANDHRRPRDDSTRYAPILVKAGCHPTVQLRRFSVKPLTSAPGHPPMEYITTSHKLSSNNDSGDRVLPPDFIIG